MSRGGDGFYDLTGSSVIRTTPRAVLIRVDDESEVWAPRSVCLDGDVLVEGDRNVSVKSWWAEREDLI